MEQQFKKILIKEPNWVGDNIFTLPAVQELRRQNPGARIAVLVKSDLAPFWEMVTEVDEVMAYDFRGGIKDAAGKSRLIRALRLGGFDLAVIFPRSFESALWMWLARIPARWGYAEEGRSLLLTRRIRSRQGYRRTHRIDYYFRLLPGIPPDATAPPSRLVPPPKLMEWARSVVQRETGRSDWGRLVGVHPRASHGPAKCWPLEYYTRLVRRLAEDGRSTVLVFGKEHEVKMAESVAEAGAPRAFSLAGKTDLKQLAALIGLCGAFVANDTGPLHLAAALGVPSVGIFGSSDPEATGPRGSAVRTLYRKVPCSPCLRRFCPTDFKCMTAISPEEVLLAIEELWDL